MPGAVRLNDVTVGHSGFPPTELITSSSNVIINGRGSVRLGDDIKIHCNRSCHDGKVSSASPNVFVNGRAKARIGDSISCGDSIKSGSANVIVNR